MIKILKIIIGICSAIIILTIPLTYFLSFKNEVVQEEIEMEEEVEIPSITIPTPEPIIPPEEKLISQMTNKEKVGQLFIFGVEGNQTIEPSNKQFLLDTQPAGVILFQRNITDENQLKNLIVELQTTNKIKMFVAIDQEGGVVPRIKWNKMLTISQKEISTEDAFNIAKERGTILKNLGINMNLAPVVEYVSSPNAFIYSRTFSGDLDQVISKSISTVEGYKKAGIISVPKHFPGHGENDIDPHKNLVSVDIASIKWDKYIQPFSSLLQKTDVEAIMMGHILFPNIDKFPSSISYEILTNRLRNNLNYKGVVISDDMQMRALSSFGSVEEIAKQALLAGEDILIYSKFVNSTDGLQRKVYNYILDEVEKGNINIDEKVKRVLRLKIQYDLIDTD